MNSLQNSMMPSGEKSRVGSSVVVEQVLTDDHDGDGDEYDDYHHHYHDNHQQQKVTRHDAGVYVCNAENGVGKPASAQMSSFFM